MTMTPVRVDPELLRILPEPMAVLDAGGTILDVNEAFADVVALPADRLAGRSLADVVVATEADVDDLLRRWRRARRLETGLLTLQTLVGPVTHRVSGASLGDHRLLVRVERRTGIAPDEPSDPRLGSLRAELAVARQAEAELRRLIQHDRLTGLPNREMLRSHLSRSLAEGSEVALLFVDLDHFKAINDVYGHDAGDTALREVASRISGAVRPRDLVARFAGDEFIVVLDGVGLSEAVTVARRVGSALRRDHVIDGDHADLCGSIGLALAEHDDTVDELIARADAAMYRAKAAGGDRVVVGADQGRAA